MNWYWSRHWFAESPLRHSGYRNFYIGSIGMSMGCAMQAMLAGWLMASLTPSPLLVSLVQSASTAPTLFFGLFAGSLADITDRRRLMLVTQGFLLIATAALGIATLVGAVGPWMVLAMTFAVGSGLAFLMPAQSACVNDLVARADLGRAAGLSAVAWNAARGVGPALAGGLASAYGSGVALLASASMFVLPVVAALRMTMVSDQQRNHPSGALVALLSGVNIGLRYVRESPPMRSVMVRTLSFSVCASAVWGLLPLVARDQLQLGAGGFGLLSTAFGIGAIVGGVVIPGQLHRRALNPIVIFGCVAWALATVILAVVSVPVVAMGAMVLAGGAWVTVLAGLSVCTQSSVPGWVRGRAFATYVLANQASMAIGSAVWGALAAAYGSRISLIASAATMFILLFIGRHAHVELGHDVTTTADAEP